MPSIHDYLSWALSVVKAVGEAGVEDVLPKYFPPTPKPCYDDDDNEWEDVDDNFPAETVTSDNKWVLVPRANVELLPM
jgi:hypothetical protein